MDGATKLKIAVVIHLPNQPRGGAASSRSNSDVVNGGHGYNQVAWQCRKMRGSPCTCSTGDQLDAMDSSSSSDNDDGSAADGDHENSGRGEGGGGGGGSRRSSISENPSFNSVPDPAARDYAQGHSSRLCCQVSGRVGPLDGPECRDALIATRC